jgi:hypothetical protein
VAKKRKKAGALVPVESPLDAEPLLGDLRHLIDTAREHVARAVNAGMTLLYWSIGDRIRHDILGAKRAGYGEQIVETVSQRLTTQYGRGFGRRNLFDMIRFAEVFPDLEIVRALSAQLGWTHFQFLTPLKDPLKRDFYAEMCRLERWSVRTLRAKIQGMLFERIARAKKPREQIRRELKALRGVHWLKVQRALQARPFLGWPPRGRSWPRVQCGVC